MDASTLNDILMESGLDLFSKISNQSNEVSNINELDKKLLPNLSTSSIVEISGASRTGKSILLLQYITKCILPVTYQDLKINGLSLNVLLVDMEMKFSVQILMEEMENYLMQYIDKEVNKESITASPSHHELISKIIHSSLARLHVTYCYGTSDNLALIFQNIETQILSKQLSLDVVFIENILNFYFEDVSVQICSIAKYIHKLLTQSVLKYLKKFDIALIYTRYIEHARGRLPSSLVSHSVQLSSLNYNGIHKCVINCDKVLHYRIERQTLEWTEFRGQLEADEDEQEDVL